MPTKLNEDRLGELLLRWDELRRQGRDVTARELCADCPELVEELARRIEAVRKMDSVLDIEDTADPETGPQRREPVASCPMSCRLGGIPAAAAPRAGRVGRNPHRSSRRAGPAGRAQTDPARQAPRQGPPPVPPRGSHHRPAATPRHRPDLRPGPGRRRAVLHHALHPGPDLAGGDRRDFKATIPSAATPAGGA